MTDRPTGQEARCETCGSDNPVWYLERGSIVCRWNKVLGCPDPFHQPPKPPVATPSEGEAIKAAKWDAAKFACDTCRRAVPYSRKLDGLRCALCPFCGTGAVTSENHRLRSQAESLKARIEVLVGERNLAFARIEELEGERDHWKANHDCQVRRKQETHDHLTKARAKGERMREVLEILTAAASRMPDAGLTMDDPRYAWWFDELIPARDTARAALSPPDTEEEASS